MDDVTLARGQLTAARTGSGRDLVVLHSLLTDRHAFDPVLPALTAKFRVTLLNLPGFHGSAPVEPRMDAYVARVREAFDELAIAPDAVLMGNGFGGTLALGFAVAHPARIGKLVVSDAAPGFPEEGKKAFRVMAEKVAAGGLGTIVDIAANRVFHAAYLEKHPQATAERRAVLLGIDPVAFQAACSALVDVDYIAQLAELAVPTLIICGELDQATPPALNRLIAAKAKSARYVELPACGHCPPLEQPQAFIAAIADFVGL